MQGRGSHSHRNALKTFECHSTNVALSLCQFACLLNKLTSELGNFFTDAMRDSNSHEFEEIVVPFTCIPNVEIEERLDEIDETLSEKEASVVTAFSWSNVSSENRGGSTKRSKMDDKVVVIDSPPGTPKK